jgi:acyl-coenzyme A synthetase/AMP-(fatty) acid ligase
MQSQNGAFGAAAREVSVKAPQRLSRVSLGLVLGVALLTSGCAVLVNDQGQSGVMRDGTALTKDELLTFLADKISPIEMPKQVEFRSQPLPKTLIGKLSRKLLLEESAPPPTAP